MTSGVKREIGFLFYVLCFLLLVGAIFGHTLYLILAGLSIYTFRTLYNLNLLTEWLEKPSKSVPENWGVWEDIYYLLYHMYKRNRRARKKLTSMLTRFQKSTQALPYATIVLNENDEIEWFNPAAKQLFNFYSKRDIGQRINNLIRQPAFVSYITKKRYKKPLEFQFDHQKILLNITPYGAGQYLLSARDVTQVKKLEEMRRDFISNASHELRTPITVMSGYIEILRELEDDITRMPLEKIQQQTQRMENIISELIDLAKLETADEIDLPLQVDVESLLNEVYEEAVAYDQGRHKLSIEIGAVQIYGRHEELRMAFSNLLTNAIRYTPEGKTIKIFTESDDNGASVCVKDEGVGISYQHVSRLTERFYRVDEGRSREVGGTGLGLSIVKQVLDRHGARLRILSKPGQGSLFCCYFPLMDMDDEA